MKFEIYDYCMHNFIRQMINQTLTLAFWDLMFRTRVPSRAFSVSFLTGVVFYLGRLGRKSCSDTMCKGYGNPEIYFLLHPQLWQASWSSTYGDQVLHWEVSQGRRPKSHRHSTLWFHASNSYLNCFLLYNLLLLISFEFFCQIYPTLWVQPFPYQNHSYSLCMKTYKINEKKSTNKLKWIILEV